MDLSRRKMKRESCTKPFIFKKQIRECAQGALLIYQTLINSLRRKQTAQDLLTNDAANGSNRTLAFGFGILSKLLALNCVWAPAFILDVQLGLHPSHRFVLVAYLSTFGFWLLGLVSVNELFSKLISFTLDSSIRRFESTMEALIVSVQVIYLTFGLANFAYIVHRRTFLHEFIVNECSTIFIPSAYQTKLVVKIFLLSAIGAILSEPTFIFLTMAEHGNQPKFLPNLAPKQFRIVKYCVVIFYVMLTNGLSLLSQIVPMFVCYLSCCLSKHLDINLTKEIQRSHMISQTRQSLPDRLDSMHFDKSYDDREHKIVGGFWLDDLGQDWPDDTAASYKHNQQKHFLNLNTNLESKVVMNCQRLYDSSGRRLSSRLTYGGQMFLLKNMARILCDYESIIKTFESKFRFVHLLQIIFSSIFIVQWLAVYCIQARLVTQQRSHENGGENARPLLTPLDFRTYFILIIFIIINTILFNRSQCLPDRMCKLRTQLFKINLNLLAGLDANCKSQWDESCAIAQLESVWSLYDHVDRISRRINFKLTGSLQYGKVCLLYIFNRLVSLILVYIQVVDIYSNSLTNNRVKF